MKTEFHAFTIMELVVAMVISALIASTSLIFYQQMNELVIRWSNSMERINRVQKSLQVLESDIARAGMVDFGEGGIRCLLGESTILYSSGDPMIREIGQSSEWFSEELRLVETSRSRLTYFDTVNLSLLFSDSIYNSSILKQVSYVQILNRP